MVRTFRRPLVLLIFVLVAGAGSVQALPATEGPREVRLQNPLVLVWDWMASLFEKAGVFIDPNGYDGPHVEPGSGMNTEAGVFIDPNGGQ
jgi:hypothetical protein